MTNRDMVKTPKGGKASGEHGQEGLPEPNIDGPTMTHPTEDAAQNLTPGTTPKAPPRPDLGGDGLKKPSR
jgi:hypothetical protein